MARLVVTAAVWFAAAAIGRGDSFYYFTSSRITVPENENVAAIWILRSGDTNEYTEVYCHTSDGTAVADRDYGPMDTYVSFQPGETLSRFPIPIFDNASYEGRRTVLITMNDYLHGVSSQAVLTIVDDERGVEFSAGEYEVGEDGGSVNITVRRDGSAGSFTVDYTTRDRTATGGADYATPSGTLSFAEGETSKTFTIPIFDDSICEDDESFEVLLGNLQGDAALGARSRTVIVIRDNDRTGPDLEHWRQQNRGTAEWLSGVTHAQGLFVAVGGNSILNSLDGRLWTTQTNVPEDYLWSSYVSFRDVMYAVGRFVAVGGREPGYQGPALGDRSCHSSHARIFTSADGSTWTSPTLPGGACLNGVAFGNGILVAVGRQRCDWDGGRSTILTSGDTLTWKLVEQGPPTTLEDVAYGHGRFVAVAGFDQVFASIDGENWIQQTNGTGAYISGIAYGNDIFIATGRILDGSQGRGVLLAALDGAVWSEVYSEVGAEFRKVAFSGGTFLALTSDGRIFTSPDGLNWSQYVSNPRYSLSDATYGNGTFVALGGNGTILQTERLLKVGLRAGDPPELSITGPVGANRYRIEASDDLAARNWTGLETISVANTPHIWRDTAAMNAPRKFYRAVLLPSLQ